MRMDLVIGRRVLKNGLVLATTLITCTALQANEHEDKSSQNAGAPQSSERNSASGSSKQQHSQKQEKFVQKALMGGQMEVKMGQLAQQNGQNQQVKSLGQALVQDHTQANQQLQQIAQSLNISAADKAGHGDDADKHAKHQDHLNKLQGKSGAEFDKEFTKMAVKHHKKDISEFEKAQNDVQDPQLKSFIQQTLPKLRQHLQMAQAAARSLGLDESTLSADDDPSTGTGAPASIQSGSEQPPSGASRPQTSIETDRDGASISGDASIGDRQIGADVDADIDRSDRSATVDVDTDTDDDGKVFQKGDGKVLGLPTSKTDGKYLGIIPKPGADNDDDDVDVSVDADADTDNSVGGAARSETGTSSDPERKVDVEVKADTDK